jgi:rSAM/selenodomain-associated transferase 1
MTDAALVIFLRRPALGEGKQRLAGEIGREAAQSVAEALLECVLEDARAWPRGVVLAPARAADADWARGLLDGAQVEPQTAGNLGERLQSVDARLRARGFRRLLFIGSDAPSLSPGYLEQARALLDRCDVALGPAHDGGVALMGSGRPWPALALLPWSTSQLGAALERSCREAGYSIGWLPATYDIDNFADVHRAATALADDSRAGLPVSLRR